MNERSHLCERARAWASLRADGELSELESALLEAHLGRCVACRGFAQGTEEVAAALRAARLEPPAPLALILPSARRNGRRVAQFAASAVAVVAVGVAAAFSGPAAGTAQASKPVSMVAGVESPDRLRELRRPGLVEQGRPIPRNRQNPGEPV